MSEVEGDLAKALHNQGLDPCVKALQTNWTALMAAVILEFVQWAWELFFYWVVLLVPRVLEVVFFGLFEFVGYLLFGVTMLLLPIFTIVAAIFSWIPLVYWISYFIMGVWWFLFGVSEAVIGIQNNLDSALIPWKIDFGTTYAQGALGDIDMARTNSKCAANMYYDMRNLKADEQFASDSDYYLNSMQAAQDFYLAFQD